VSFNFGFVVFVFEMNNQFRHLFGQLEDAFDYRMEESFEKKFINCIRHHQLIIK